MPDVYANTATADPAVLEKMSEALEIRATDPAQCAMLDAYLAEIPFPPGARVLEIGCGTGAIARVLATRPGIAEVIGVDPTPLFLERARQLSEGMRFLSFVEGDGRCLPFPDRSFDVVAIHTVLSHVPGPEEVLAEAFRVMWPGGWLAVFDGDYATTSVAIGTNDPLQACADAAIANLVNDPWLVRRLTPLGEGPDSA